MWASDASIIITDGMKIDLDISGFATPVNFTGTSAAEQATILAMDKREIFVDIPSQGKRFWMTPNQCSFRLSI